jgi:hypothetical protein
VDGVLDRAAKVGQLLGRGLGAPQVDLDVHPAYDLWQRRRRAVHLEHQTCALVHAELEPPDRPRVLERRATRERRERHRFAAVHADHQGRARKLVAREEAHP